MNKAACLKKELRINSCYNNIHLLLFFNFISDVTGNGNSAFIGSASTIGLREQLVNGTSSGQQTPTNQIASPTDDKSIITHDQINNSDMKVSLLY